MVAAVRVVWNAVQIIYDAMGGIVGGLVVLVGTAINDGLIRPLNDFLTLIKAPITVPAINLSHAQQLLDESAAHTRQNWADIKDALLDVATAYNTVGAAAAKAVGPGGGAGGRTGRAGATGKQFDNTAARGDGNTVAGGGLALPSVGVPDILGGARSPGGPNDNGKSPLSEALQKHADEALATMDEIRGRLAQGIADSLGDGIANGFAAALGKGGIVAGFKALAQTLLASLGAAMVEFGKAALVAAISMDAIKKSLASFLPGGAITAALAMIAFGGGLAGVASSAFGGSSSSGYSTRGYTDTVTRVTVAPTPATQQTTNLSPAQPIVFAPTILGVNDPQAQRALGTMYDLAVDRGLVKRRA